MNGEVCIVLIVCNHSYSFSINCVIVFETLKSLGGGGVKLSIFFWGGGGEASPPPPPVDRTLLNYGDCTLIYLRQSLMGVF